MKKYFLVWLRFAINGFASQLSNRFALVILLVGKIIRFSVFTILIILLLDKTKALAGYSLDQTILFFLSFNLIDITSQLLFREVYRFRSAVVSGTFDYYLLRPISALFRSLLGGPDVIDFITLIPLIFAIIIFLNRLQINNLGNILIYILLLLVGFIIALAFHILVLSLAVVTTEIDHAIMMYRDVVAMGRFPIDIYREPLRGILTFVIPVGIMMTFPAKALMGLLSPWMVIYAILFSLLLFYLSLKVWNFSLKQYSSASS